MTTFLEESEIYAKWKKEHGDVVEENGMTPHEWYVRNYVDTRLLPAIESQRKEMREKVLELVQKYHDTKYHNDAEKVLSDIISALDN